MCFILVTFSFSYIYVNIKICVYVFNYVITLASLVCVWWKKDSQTSIQTGNSLLIPEQLSMEAYTPTLPGLPCLPQKASSLLRKSGFFFQW